MPILTSETYNIHHIYTDVEKYIYRKANEYGLSKIVCVDKIKFIDLQVMVVPEENREQGIGSSFMQDICAEADRRGKVIGTCPEPLVPNWDESDKAKLIEWYKNFGFVENPDESQFRGVTYVRLPSTAETENRN